MLKSNTTMAQQLTQAAIAFERRHSGHTPKSVTVILSDNTLVITLHGAMSPAEKALAQRLSGAALMQEFHRQMFNHPAESLRQEIKKITGVEVCESAVGVVTTGTVVQAFTTGTVVQVFLLACDVPSETWSGNGSPDLS
jgi:uncharacterized protein YbcI